MRFLITLFSVIFVTLAHGQVCVDQLSSVPLSNWSASTNTAYTNDAPSISASDLYLDALNEPEYDGIWSIGSGVSNAHLSVSENASISTFIGVKRRNVVAPNDNIVPDGGVYIVETGYSPLTQNSSETGTLAKWNFLMYINMGEYVFEDVDIRLYIDMDPCFDALVEDMVEINVSEQFTGFFGNANFGAFGINQNLASNFIQAFGSDNVQAFNPEDEGFYTLAIGIYDVCGNLKNWHEVLVNVTDATDGDSNGNGIADSQEEGGCTNASACNYVCTATFNDGSCDFTSCAGCTVENACNYDATATISNPSGCLYPVDIYGDDYLDCQGLCLNDADGDGICDEDEIDGCTDATACNYVSAATDDDGSCEYAETAYDCDGNCLSDIDSDGVCDEFEVDGCDDPGACNFDPNASEDDGSCEYSTCAGCTVEEACNFDATATISNTGTCIYAEGCDTCSGEVNGTGVVIDNDSDDDGVCDANEIVGCTTPSACNFNPAATDSADCDFDTCKGCTLPAACNYDDAATIANNSSCVFADAPCEVCSGETDGTGSVIDNDSDDDGVCDADEINGCTTTNACNYDSLATENDGSCEFDTCAGCTISLACNYNANATIANNSTCVFPESASISGACDACSGEVDGTGVVVDNDADDDGVCDSDEILGCTEVGACNYNSEATEDDATCEYTSCVGCTNPAGCNYNASATIPAPCIYPEPFSDCDGCLNDVNNNDVCDQLETSGCTDAAASNYNPIATLDDGSCILNVVGCMLPWAPNYDENATIQGFPVGIVCFAPPGTGGSPTPLGLVTGCTDENACNFLPGGDPTLPCDYDCLFGCQNENYCDYDPAAPYPGPCTDLESCYGCTVSNACNFDAENTFEDGTCEYESCTGCTDSAACNYDATALINTGCVYATGCDYCSGETDGTGAVVDGDADFDGVCDVDEIAGCMNSNACNYNPEATDSDGTCEYISCAGCGNPEACNYDPSATINIASECIVPTGCEFCSEGSIVDGDTDNDGICDADEIAGCTNANACNYNSEATDSDGSCEFTTCQGCMNSEACNYDTSATIPDPSTCVFASGCETCSGVTDGTGTTIDNDADNDGVCDADEILGCTNVNACNYDPAATEADGSCDFTICIGCLEEGACNYEGDDPTITLNEPIQCIFPEPGLDCAGNCLNDADGDLICDEDEVAGCQDASACNYDAAATDDDGSCAYPEEFLDCAGNCLVDEDDDGVCDQLEVFGCTIVLSCNFDPSATENDGSCEFDSCSGCKNPDACNYDPEAILSEPLLCVFDTNPELVFDAVMEISDNPADWPANNYLTSSDGAESVTFEDHVGRLADGRYNVTRIYTATSLCGATEACGQLLIAAADQPSGCTNATATNYDAGAVNDDGSCSYDPACLGDLNGDAIIGASDLLIMLSSFGLPCE